MSSPSSLVESKPSSQPTLSSPDIDAGRLKGTGFLSDGIKDLWVHDIMRPVEEFCARRRITPNQITWVGFALTLLSALTIATDHLIWGGWLMIWGGCCDFLDGRIARRFNLQSESGAFFDSVLDRYMDSATLFALAYYFRDSWVSLLVFLAILGSATTPYIRAKAESLGLKSDGGQMQRPERIAYLGIGTLLSGFYICLMYPFMPADESSTPWFLILAIGIVAWSSNKVAIQRSRDAYNALKSRRKH